MNTQAAYKLDYQQSLPVHLLRTSNRDGEQCYFVLRASRAHFTQLIAKRGKEEVNVADFGQILASGYGRHPSASILSMLKTRYNIEVPLSELDA